MKERASKYMHRNKKMRAMREIALGCFRPGDQPKVMDSKEKKRLRLARQERRRYVTTEDMMA